MFRIQDSEVVSVQSVPAQVMDWGVHAVHAPDVWKETKGEGVKVAVLDTGVDTTHPDLIQNIKDGINLTSGNPKDFEDRQGHGTHVAGIIAGCDNDIGVIGIAPNADLYVAKILGDNGEGSIDAIIQGIAYAVHNKVDIISMSLGCEVDPGPNLHRAIKYAYDQGIIIVAATGNEAHGIDWPAVYDEVISVGAISKDKALAGFSNYGTQVDVVAPGVDILSTYPVGGYATLSGTSMATPIVSGVLALYVSYCKKRGIPVSPQGIMEMLSRRSDDLGERGRDNRFGNGLIDALQLVQA